MKTPLKMLPLAVLSTALLAGCASGPNQESAAERLSRIQANLRVAESLTETASAQSLTKATQILSMADLTGEPETLELSTFGGRLWSSLYPDLPNPYEAGGQVASSGSLADAAPAGSQFFQQLRPALALLSPGPVPDDSHASDMGSGLSAADNINPDSVLPPYLRAVLLSRQGKPADSVRPLYEECLRRDRAFYPAKLGVIETAIAQGTAASDLALLTKYAGELPTPLAQQTETARILLAAGQPQLAADAAARALLLAPGTPDLLLLRASAFDAMGDWYQELYMLDALLTVAPTNADALARKATVLFEKAGNPDGAMKILSEAEPKFPEDAAFPELRGRILLSRGNSAEGEAALARALTLDPNRVSTLALLAGAAARAGRWQEAEGYLQRVPEQDRDVETLQVAWQIAMNLADYEQALTIAQTLEKRRGGDEALLYHVRTLLAANRSREAADLATSDLQNVKTPAVRASLFFLRAQASHQAGDAPEAGLADLRAALRENPDDLETLLAIADTLSGGGEYRKALAYLKHAQELSPEDADIRARVNNATRLAGSGN
ncbi:MAG: tetratricopeptide repeat protein [Spirochaetia bacterium]